MSIAMRPSPRQAPARARAYGVPRCHKSRPPTMDRPMTLRMSTFSSVESGEPGLSTNDWSRNRNAYRKICHPRRRTVVRPQRIAREAWPPWRPRRATPRRPPGRGRAARRCRRSARPSRTRRCRPIGGQRPESNVCPPIMMRTATPRSQSRYVCRPAGDGGRMASLCGMPVAAPRTLSARCPRRSG